jgi:hypothetical protein
MATSAGAFSFSNEDELLNALRQTSFDYTAGAF